MKRGGLQRKPLRDTARTCATCGTSFAPKRSSQRYCSFGCAPQRQPKGPTLTCATCGKDFPARPSEVGRKRRYCSRSCWYAAPVSAATRSKRSQAQRGKRQGSENPSYRDGKRAGQNDRAGLRRFKSGQEACQYPGCGSSPRCHEHHVVYRQHVRDVGGDEWDPRDALRLCVSCHAAHHRGGTRVPVSALRAENIEYAFELLGAAAYDYLRRYYNDDGARLNEALAHYQGGKDAR